METFDADIIERLRSAATGHIWGEWRDDPSRMVHDAANEIERLRSMLFAPLSPDELRLIDKHCNWVAFGHAWNAVMKRRQDKPV